MNGEDAVFDERFRPDQIQELALGDQSSSTTEEDDQHVVGLGFQGDGVPVSREPALGHVQHEFRERIPLGDGHES